MNPSLSHRFTCSECQNTIRSTTAAPRDRRCTTCQFGLRDSTPAPVVVATMAAPIGPAAVDDLDPHERAWYSRMRRSHGR